MYVADSVGYLGYAILGLTKYFFIGQITEKRFADAFLWICIVGATSSILLVAIASRQFRSIETQSERSE